MTFSHNFSKGWFIRGNISIIISASSVHPKKYTLAFEYSKILSLYTTALTEIYFFNFAFKIPIRNPFEIKGGGLLPQLTSVKTP